MGVAQSEVVGLDCHRLTFHFFRRKQKIGYVRQLFVVVAEGGGDELGQATSSTSRGRVQLDEALWVVDQLNLLSDYVGDLVHQLSC